MLTNVNKLLNFEAFEACLHFLASKCPLTQVGMHYKSKQVAHIIRMTGIDSSIPIDALSRLFSK